MEIHAVKDFSKNLVCKPDKSMTIRAVLFNALLGDGGALIKNPLISADTLSAVDCARALGADITVSEKEIAIKSGKLAPAATLDCGNSASTMRILCGLLSGREGKYTLTGDGSLSARPMDRVAVPLSLMGADIKTAASRPPVEISGAPLHGIDYAPPEPSALVKTAVLTAGLFARGDTVVREKIQTRDHTENMLAALGADIERGEGYVRVSSRAKPHSADINVVGDISSSAYAFALAAGSGGKAEVSDVGVNKTRTGILDVLSRMGASVKAENVGFGVEPKADLTVSGRVKNPVVIRESEVPRLIDELPIIAVLAALCKGESRLCGVGELRYKETDRLAAILEMLAALGVEAHESGDDLRVIGKGYIEGGATLSSRGDHRMAMAAACALALSDRGGTLLGGEAVRVSYPDFFDILFQEK